MDRSIVNPIALHNCSVQFGDATAKVLDISFTRLVVQATNEWPELAENQSLSLQLLLDRQVFPAITTFRGKGEGWLRFAFEKMVPSSRAHLRSFLSPKKVGESLIEDWRTDELRHYHGLNESELWFDPNGGVLFTYLDQIDADTQFIVRMGDHKGPMQVGKIARKDYMAMSEMGSELPLIPLSDREIYAKLGECRDIVTNFRPNGQIEYNLKQRLLRVISDNLYSTGDKVEMSRLRPQASMPLPLDR